MLYGNLRDSNTDSTMVLHHFTSFKVHGGGAWFGQRFKANFHTPNPDKPVVNQHFSTLYNPTKTTIKTQLQKQQTRYCYRDNKQVTATETLQRQLTRYCYRENKKTTNKILLQLHYRDNKKYTATETLQRKQTRHYYRDTTETTNKTLLHRHYRDNKQDTATETLQRQQTRY